MRTGRTPARSVRFRHAHTLEDVRTIAKRVLPTAVYDYVEGGGGDEVTIARNRAGWQSLEFERRALVDVSVIDQTTTILGTPVSSPLVLAPVGLAAVAHPDGEKAAAVAAAGRGIISTLASGASWNIEEVAAATDGAKWFQLYIWRDRGITREIVERAKAAGYLALVLTVDVPVAAHRERDTRNGFQIPPRPTLRHAADVLRHASWFGRLAWNETFGHRLTMGNFTKDAGVGKRVVAMTMVNTLFDPRVTWDDVAWLRSIWDGPIVIKGITTTADAVQSVECGAAGVWVSNHGGRQLDGLPATVDVLPAIVDEVAGRAEVYLDGGIRRGSDVVKALALGATACMIGRPYVYGLAAGGEAGVRLVLDTFVSEIDATLALLGVPAIGDLDRSVIRNPIGYTDLDYFTRHRRQEKRP